MTTIFPNPDEHSLFLFLGLERLDLKQKAFELYDSWTYSMDRIFTSNGVDPYKIVLDANDFNNLANVDISEAQLFDLIDDLRNFKLIIIELLEAGDWIGWLWLSFVKHIHRELEYFNLKLNGITLSPATDAFYWNVTNAEHAGSTAHLLDPAFDNNAVISSANETYQKLLTLIPEERKQYIYLSENYAKELDNFGKKYGDRIKNGTIKSVIHPLLVDHIDRETKRSLYSLQTQK
jgi:hypothetical protein